MFLQKMMQKDAAASGGGMRSAPISPASSASRPQSGASNTPSNRSMPPGGAHFDSSGGRGDVDSLSSSQPLQYSHSAAASAQKAFLPPSSEAWQQQAQAAPAPASAAAVRNKPGMRYEIYDLGTSQLRAELATARSQPGVEWQAWGSWIAAELEERSAGEDILGALTAMDAALVVGGAEFDNDTGGNGGSWPGSGGALVLDGRSDSVMSTNAEGKRETVKLRGSAGSGTTVSRRRLSHSVFELGLAKL